MIKVRAAALSMVFNVYELNDEISKPIRSHGYVKGNKPALIMRIDQFGDFELTTGENLTGNNFSVMDWKFIKLNKGDFLFNARLIKTVHDDQFELFEVIGIPLEKGFLSSIVPLKFEVPERPSLK